MSEPTKLELNFKGGSLLPDAVFDPASIMGSSCEFIDHMIKAEYSRKEAREMWLDYLLTIREIAVECARNRVPAGVDENNYEVEIPNG